MPIFFKHLLKDSYLAKISYDPYHFLSSHPLSSVSLCLFHREKKITEVIAHTFFLKKDPSPRLRRRISFRMNELSRSTFLDFSVKWVNSYCTPYISGRISRSQFHVLNYSANRDPSKHLWGHEQANWFICLLTAPSLTFNQQPVIQAHQAETVWIFLL